MLSELMPVILSTLVLFLLGLLFGRAWLLLLPTLGWPLVFLAFSLGWWGYGLGESWQFFMFLWILLGVSAVGAGMFLHRLIHHSPDRS